MQIAKTIENSHVLDSQNEHYCEIMVLIRNVRQLHIFPFSLYYWPIVGNIGGLSFTAMVSLGARQVLVSCLVHGMGIRRRAVGPTENHSVTQELN